MTDLRRLTRLNTPTVYNGWEQMTRRNPGREGFNLEETHDFMPEMGPMVGIAVTVVIEPGNPEHPKRTPDGWSRYRQYIGGIPGPKIVVVQDLDKPRTYGASWGEVNSGIHRALGCVGAIIDGGIRDLDEMRAAGFKALARRLCVGHAFSHPVRWGEPVEVFGTRIEPGQLIHADKHGFLAVPKGEEAGLLEAALFMDANECATMISSARESAGRTIPEVLRHFDEAAARFDQAARERFGKKGEF